MTSRGQERMEKGRAGRGTKGLLALLCASMMTAWMTACAATTTGSTGAPSHPHPMQADQLKEVMRGFDAAVRKKVPTETDVHDRWDGVFPRIAAAAAQLKIAATGLAGHPPKGLEIPARGRFQVLGQSLVDAVAELQDAAERGDADAVSAARFRLGSACRDCHERYRPDSPGVPDAFR